MRTVVVGAGALAQALTQFLRARHMASEVVSVEQVASSAAVRRAEWIIEAAGSNLESKRTALAAISAASSGDCMVTSDASVHTRFELLTGADTTFMARHAVVHFFFPLDRMTLVELALASRAGVLPMCDDMRNRLRHLLTDNLQRRVVICSDRPGYVANRLGLAALAQAIVLAEEEDVPLARADQVLSTLLGWPRTAAFGTVDLIGPGLFADLLDTLADRLVPTDPLVSIASRALVSIRRLQCCSAMSYYSRDQNGKAFAALDFQDCTYKALSLEPAADNEKIYVEHVRAWVLDYMRLVSEQTALSMGEIWQVMAGSYGWRAVNKHSS